MDIDERSTSKEFLNSFFKKTEDMGLEDIADLRPVGKNIFLLDVDLQY